MKRQQWQTEKVEVNDEEEGAKTKNKQQKRRKVEEAEEREESEQNRAPW